MKRLMSLLIIALPLLLMAQQYSLDDLIRQGMEKSWTTQRNRLSFESSASQLSSATWNLLPDADLGLRINQNLHNQTSSADLTSAFNFSISKVISLNDPAWFNYRQAKISRQQAELDYQTGISAYAYDVFDAYIKVLSAQKQLHSLTENLAIQTRVWEQAKVLRQLGKNTDFDVKQSEIAVLNSNIAILQLENSIANARSRLFALVQMNDEGFELADLEPIIDKQIPVSNPERTSEVIILNQELKHSELELKLDKLDNFPRVNLAYNFDRTVSGADFDFDRYNTNHGVSLSLSYPLLNYFKNGESTYRTKISQKLSQLAIDEKSDQIVRDYNSAVQELQYLLRMNELYTEKLSQSSEQITQAEERYRLGLIELLELDKTRTD